MAMETLTLGKLVESLMQDETLTLHTPVYVRRGAPSERQPVHKIAWIDIMHDTAENVMVIQVFGENA